VEGEPFQAALPDGGSVHLALLAHSERGRDCERASSTGGDCLEHDSAHALDVAAQSCLGIGPKAIPQMRPLRGRFLEHVGGSVPIHRRGWARLGVSSRF
jgi:hypothetical protein